MSALKFNALQHIFRCEFEEARVWVEKSSEIDAVSPRVFGTRAGFITNNNTPAPQMPCGALALNIAS
jgi:hypothetical protein